MKPGRKGEVIPVHEDEYATIIAYALASEEYYDALQAHIREENETFGNGAVDGLDGDDFMSTAAVRGMKSSHLTSFQQQLKHNDDDIENETVVIIGDGSTADAEGEFLRGFGGSKHRSSVRGMSKDGSDSRSNSIDLPKNGFIDTNPIDSRRLSPGNYKHNKFYNIY